MHEQRARACAMRAVEIWAETHDKSASLHRRVRGFLKRAAYHKDVAASIARALAAPDRMMGHEKFVDRADRMERPIAFLKRVYADELSTGRYYADMLKEDDPYLYFALQDAIGRLRRSGRSPRHLFELVPGRPAPARAPTTNDQRISDRLRLFCAMAAAKVALK